MKAVSATQFHKDQADAMRKRQTDNQVKGDVTHDQMSRDIIEKSDVTSDVTCHASTLILSSSSTSPSQEAVSSVSVVGQRDAKPARPIPPPAPPPRPIIPPARSYQSIEIAPAMMLPPPEDMPWPEEHFPFEAI